MADRIFHSRSGPLRNLFPDFVRWLRKSFYDRLETTAAPAQTVLVVSTDHGRSTAEDGGASYRPLMVSRRA